MKNRGWRNPASRTSDRGNVDCSNCIRRKYCENAEENSFCTRWQGRAPDRKGTDPNDAWRRGEDVSF